MTDVRCGTCDRPVHPCPDCIDPMPTGPVGDLISAAIKLEDGINSVDDEYGCRACGGVGRHRAICEWIDFQTAVRAYVAAVKATVKEAP